MNKPNRAQMFLDYARLFLVVLSIAAFICFLFGLAASLVVVALFHFTGPGPDSALIPYFAAKAAVFGVLAVAAFCAAYRSGARPAAAPVAPVLHGTARRRGWFALVPVLILGAVLVFPRLGAYPWAAPDEIHHFTVARNLATLGVYASGHPDAEMRQFDTYDSVGPPVILPVALAFRLFGVHVAAGRMVMAGYFLGLCVVLFALLKPAVGASASAIGVVFMMCSFGSVYLGRTLYGEVPGLAWLALGLLAWRRAVRGRGGIGWGLIAGIAFGLAVLCKSILILSAFAFLGALIYDRLTFRTIRMAHVLAPAAGLIVLMGAWWTVQTFSQHDVTNAAGGTLGIYKHNLMFGLRSAPRALEGLLSASGATLVLAMIFAMLGVFRPGYDPSLVVLWFLCVFYAWWWAFFTPGVMPRYLWFSAAIGSAFTAWFLVAAKKSITSRLPRKGIEARIVLVVMFALVVIVVAVAARGFVKETNGVYAVDELRDDYAVSEWVAGLPPGVRIAATWPLPGTLNLLANRPVSALETIPATLAPNEVFIVDTMTRPRMLGALEPTQRFGRYAVLTAKE